MPLEMEVVEAGIAPNLLMPERSNVAVFDPIPFDSSVWVVSNLMVGG